MKTLYLSLVICILSNFNLFAQYYIGQDIIDQIKYGKTKSFHVDDNFISPNYEVYLEGISTRGFISDITTGFDRIKYSLGDSAVLTFKRSGKNVKVEEEVIWIAANNDITTDDFNIEKSNGYYVFYLRNNETKKITIHPNRNNQKIDRISIGIGKFGPSSEGRTYIIPYPPNSPDTFKSVDDSVMDKIIQQKDILKKHN